MNLSVLETGHREALPKGWSYPVGVEDLRRALGDIPGVAAAPISFVAKSGASATVFEQQRRQGEPYLVVTSGLKRGARDSQDPSRPSWRAVVYAVPSTLRKVTRRAMEERVFPSLKDWLLMNRSDTQLDGGVGFQFYIQENGPSFAIVTRESASEAPSREEFVVSDGRGELE